MSLKAIAQQLGISVTTVSRAINGYSDVAPSTRAKVLATAKTMGYRPNMMARRLKMGKIDSVGLLIPACSLQGDNERLLEIFSQISRHLAQQDIDLLLLSEEQKDVSHMLQRVIESQRINALIVAHTQPDDTRLKLLQQHDFPFIAMGRSELDKPYAWFDFDNQQGTYLATQYLLAQGHQRIALLCENSPQTFAAQRKTGYQQGLMDAGITLISDYIQELPSSRRLSYEATLTLLDSPTPPTAIVTTNSILADGAAQALQNRDLLNRGVTLIAYDGLPHDSIITTPIDAIIQASSEQVGQQIANMTLSLLQGQSLAELQVLWQPQLSVQHID